MTLSSWSDDPAHAGLPNLIEYSQGSSPTLLSNANAPKPSLANGQWRFSYRRDGLEAAWRRALTPAEKSSHGNPAPS